MIGEHREGKAEQAAIRARLQSGGAARMALLSPGELTGDQLALYNEITQGPRRTQTSQIPLTDGEGRLLGPFGPMLLSPRIGAAVQQVGAALRVEPTLPDRMRELVILTVAADRRSEFEWLAHERPALVAGATSGQLQQLRDGDIPRELPADEECALRTARHLLDAAELTDAEYAEAVDALGAETLSIVVWLVGYYSMLAMTLAIFRPELPDLDRP